MPSSVCHKQLAKGWGWIWAACLQHPRIPPEEKPGGKAVVSVWVLDNSAERGYVKPAEKKRHGKILCGRNYYEKQGKKKKEYKNQSVTYSSVFLVFLLA